MKYVKRIGLLSLVSMLLLSFLVTSTYAFGPVTVFSSTSSESASYARALKLQYSGSNNGKMYATHEKWTENQTPHKAGPAFPIYESTNGGQTWTKVGEVADVDPNEGLREQGFLFELPQQIGSMPAGTMLFAANAFPGGELVHHIKLFKSNDLGRNWTYVSTIATGGAYGGGMTWASDGIWEPFLMVANNKLICFYADEMDDDNNQMIVHRTSTDGINWSDTVVDVALGNLRPGMPTVTKMGNGDYMLVYEMVNFRNDQIHYKISSDPENWGVVSDPGIKLNYYQGQTPGSQPYVIWLPGGGPNGTVVISAGRSDKLFLNYNYGQGTWKVQDSLIPKGYSRALVPMGDSTVYAISSARNTSTNKNDVVGGTVDILPSNNIYGNNLVMLVNHGTGKALDLIGGQTENGVVINQWTYDENSNNQRWSLVPTGSGSFRITSVLSGDEVSVLNDSTDNEAQIHNWDYRDKTAHQWNFVDVGNGLFKIINVNSGKALEVSNGSTANGAKVQQYDYTGKAWQQWRIQPVGNYYIQAKLSGKYVNGAGAKTANGTSVIQWPFETNNWFEWRFDHVKDGWYKVTYLRSPSKVIEVDSAAMQAGLRTQLWDYEGSDNQLVRLVPLGDGSFKFYFKHSGMAWELDGGSVTNGAPMEQNTEAASDNQKFYIEKITPPLSNQAPTTSGVSITGMAEVGQVLHGTYSYGDADHDAEGASTFQWYRGAAADGSDKAVIAQATARTYTLTSADAGKYVFFQVTPVAVTGMKQGKPAESAGVLIPMPDQTAPSTSVARSVQPNEAGWNNASVTITLKAVDNAGGSGVTELTYGATGAQTIAETTVSGSTANVTISGEGTTTLSFYAKDAAGNAEAVQTVQIRIDKTAPTVTFTGGGTYTIDQTVNVTCTAEDPASGLASNPCSAPLADSPAYMLGLGSHTVSVQATDNAGNLTQQSVEYKVGVTPDSLLNMIKQWVKGAGANGIVQSLTAKMQQKNPDAFMNEVSAQAGKSITAEQANLLKEWIQALMQQGN